MGAGISSFDFSYLQRSCSSISMHFVFDSVLDTLRKISKLKANLAPATSSSIPFFRSSMLILLGMSIVSLEVYDDTEADSPNMQHKQPIDDSAAVVTILRSRRCLIDKGGIGG